MVATVPRVRLWLLRDGDQGPTNGQEIGFGDDDAELPVDRVVQINIVAMKLMRYNAHLVRDEGTVRLKLSSGSPKEIM